MRTAEPRHCILLYRCMLIDGVDEKFTCAARMRCGAPWRPRILGLKKTDHDGPIPVRTKGAKTHHPHSLMYQAINNVFLLICVEFCKFV